MTGVLASRPTSRDIKIAGFSMGLNGQELIQDCTIELTIGRRYGLIGANGSGKTNFLQCLAAREVRHSSRPSYCWIGGKPAGQRKMYSVARRAWWRLRHILAWW